MASLPSELLDIGKAVVASALGALVTTALAMTALAAVLAIGGYLYVAPRSTLAALAAVLAALALSLVCGTALAVKRAMTVGIAAGVRRSQLASRVVGPLFDRIAAIPSVAATQRLPLAQLEARLREVVANWLGTAPGGVRGMIARGLVTRIERVTLAEMRSADGGATGIDLEALRAGLIGRIDDHIMSELRATNRYAAWMLAGGAALGSIAITVALRHLG